MDKTVIKNEFSNEPNLRLSEPFIDLEAGMYSLSENDLEPEIKSNINTHLTNMIASEPKILTRDELQQIKDDIENNINYSSHKIDNDAPNKFIDRLLNVFELKTEANILTYSEMRECME